MSKLGSQASEFIARSAVLPILVRDGFTPYIPEWDEGIDFILYREADDLLIKVQLKSRWSIDRKYLGRNIAILFPDGNQTRSWYLSPHDAMVAYAADNTPYLKSGSWAGNVSADSEKSAAGLYNTRQMSRKMRDEFQVYLIVPSGNNEAIYERFRKQT